ncbi:hypothetical protein FB451DRAFT_1169152 [Mycena latifolia]|nr:hypothetical protein FB451DRAFT_1169152 [Mycena latifolia]
MLKLRKHFSPGPDCSCVVIRYRPCYFLFHVVQFLYSELTSPLRHPVGPENPSLILGKFKEMTISELHTSDLKAINHIVTNNSVYQKAPSNLDNISRLFDKGILEVELDEHKRHRRVLNPAFGVAQIRVITELRDIWAGRVAQENGTICIEVFSGLRLMTLDVIGQAEQRKSDKLTQVFTDLFHSPYANRNAAFRLSQSFVPILKLLVRITLRFILFPRLINPPTKPVPGAKLRRTARSKMRLIGSHIVSNARANIKTTEDDNVLRGRRDLLSVLLKANSAANIPESQGLTDAEART